MFRAVLSSVRSRALSTRSALLRSDVVASAPAKVEEVAAVAAVEAPKPASSFRSRFTWFLSGVAITAIGFSLVLRNDVLETSTQLRRTIDALHSDVILQETETKKRLKALEAALAAKK